MGLKLIMLILSKVIDCLIDNSLILRKAYFYKLSMDTE